MPKNEEYACAICNRFTPDGEGWFYREGKGEERRLCRHCFLRKSREDR